MSYAEKIVAGDQRAAARLMRDIDDDFPTIEAEMKELYPHTGRAVLTGITGAPGVGKSTLTDVVISILRRQQRTVGVLAVDPTSPFTGGAILGDRIRMQRHGLDNGVFIRSIATRGHLGGVSRSTLGMLHVLDALGVNDIIIETVGVGQDEVEIAGCVQTVVLVLAPGLGDGVQSIKAGIMEIADIFVVNKADRDGAERTRREVEEAVRLSDREAREWTPPVLLTSAHVNQGIEEVVQAMLQHQAYLREDGDKRLEELTRRHVRDEILQLTRDAFIKETVARLNRRGELDSLLDSVACRRLDPFAAARLIIDSYAEK